MSTSEYEDQNHKEGDNLFPSTIEPALPEDFSEEDVVFAQELGTLFAPQDEILPPYYTQTLLQAEDPRYSVVDNAFAQRTSVRVFRELNLRRRLFPRRRSPLGVLGETVRDVTVSKSFLAWAAALVLVMMMTVAFTAPSFEQGVSLLLHNSRNGIVNVPKAPPVLHGPADYMFDARSYNTHPSQVLLLTVGPMLSFPIYWPQWMPANYALDSVKIYEYPDNTWANGPVVDLVFDVDATRFAPKGTGQIVIREFNPNEQVLQVVQDGYAYPIDPDQYGENPRAIYVDGQWIRTSQEALRAWQHGGRSEIIYQQDNVVFWIAGDQRDGNNEQVLWKLAQTLQTTPTLSYTVYKGFKATILLPPDNGDSARNPFINDIYQVASLDGSGDHYYMTMSAYALSGKVGSSQPTSHRH